MTGRGEAPWARRAREYDIQDHRAEGAAMADRLLRRLDPAREISITDVLLAELEDELARDAEERRIRCAAARDMLDNPERCPDRAGIARDVASGRSLRASAIRRWAIRIRRILSALIRPRPEMRRKRRAF